MSSANASTPANLLFILIPKSLCSNSCMICLIRRLNNSGDVLAPYLTPFWLSIGCYGSWLIRYVDWSFSYICHRSLMISLGTPSPISSWNMSTCLAESKAFLRSMNIAMYVSCSFFYISRISCRLFICSVVDLLGVNPYCWSYHALLVSKCYLSFSCNHLSSMLRIMCLSVIGL